VIPCHTRIFLQWMTLRGYCIQSNWHSIASQSHSWRQKEDRDAHFLLGTLRY
jgi:hypothetical protein